MGKRKKVHVTLIVIGLCFLSIFSLVSTCAADDQPIVFSDPVFERLLKTELEKDEIRASDLQTFTGMQILADQFLFLAAEGRPSKRIVLYGADTFEYNGQRYTGFGTIETLADLEHFPSLTTLYVAMQPKLDASTIPNVGQIARLTITRSNLQDISFLSQATNLLSLNLNSNAISDLGDLVYCLKLRYLSADHNAISDLSALANLLELETLSFYSNKITDISPLAKLKKLEEIGFYDNQVVDISALRNLPTLKKVEFINNRIKDVTPLKDFASFERLALTGNPIKNIKLLKHIKNLEF